MAQLFKVNFRSKWKISRLINISFYRRMSQTRTATVTETSLNKRFFAQYNDSSSVSVVSHGTFLCGLWKTTKRNDQIVPSGERERRRRIFLISFSNLMLSYIFSFNSRIALTVDSNRQPE